MARSLRIEYENAYYHVMNRGRDHQLIFHKGWDQQKQHQNYMISVLKENSVATFVEPISFDQNDPINTGVEEYSRYENNGITFSLVRYRVSPKTNIDFSYEYIMPSTILRVNLAHET